MRKFIGFTILGGAMLAAIPASASNTNFNFLDCGDAGNPSCSANLSPYAVTGNGITATATAFFVQGTNTGPTGGDTIQTGQVGSYSDAGLGICEEQSNSNCNSPYHQIDNGSNPGTGQDFEFMLIQFSAAVNLSDVQLGNFGGGAANPFDATYFTSTNTSLATAINSMTYSSLLSGTDGFTEAQTSCTSGAALDQSVQGISSADCDTEAIDSVSGTNVTYLLIGASVSSSQVGDDFFKIQDIDANKGTGGGGTNPTPEPATFGLLGLALTGLGVYGNKRKSGGS